VTFGDDITPLLSPNGTSPLHAGAAASPGINTRLRHLLKEARASVMGGPELTNIRSHRQRAKDDAAAKKAQVRSEGSSNQ